MNLNLDSTCWARGDFYEDDYNINDSDTLMVDDDSFFYSTKEGIGLNYVQAREVCCPLDLVPNFDLGYSSDLKRIRDKVKDYTRMDQFEVNSFYYLCTEAKIDLTKISWSGLFISYCDLANEKMRGLLDKVCRKLEVIVVDAAVPGESTEPSNCVDEIQMEEEEKEKENKEIVEEEYLTINDAVVPVPVDEPLKMGLLTTGFCEKNFKMGTRFYSIDYEGAAPWSEPVLLDYLEHLRLNKLDVSIRDYGYDDPFVAAKWAAFSLKVAAEIARILPLAREYYLPGDGLGLYSLVLKRAGFNVYSSEPEMVGRYARMLGLIDSDRPFEPKLDDGQVVLLLFNIPDDVEVSWRGPTVVWQQSLDRPWGQVVSDTGRRLWVKDIEVLSPVGLQGCSSKYAAKVRKRILALAKKFNKFTDGVIVADKSMSNVAIEAGFKIYDSGPRVVLGKSYDQFDVNTFQDQKTHNKDYRFYCKIGDVFLIDGTHVRVKKFGKHRFLIKRKYVAVDFIRREKTMPVVKEEDSGMFVNSLTDRGQVFAARYRGRTVFVERIEKLSEMTGYRIKVRLKSFVQRPMLRLRAAVSTWYK